MNVFDEINGWSGDELLRRIELPLAKDGKSYRCPVCGKGKGGDGIRPRENSKGQTRWKCFGCGKNFSNFDLAAAVFGIDTERDTSEAAKRLAAEFGLNDDSENFSSSRKTARQSSGNVERDALPTMSEQEAGSVKTMDEKKSASTTEPKSYSRLYKFCRDNYDLKKFVDSCGGTWRGFTFEMLNKVGCLYHAEYLVAEDEKVPVVIFPYDDSLFFWREVNGKRRGVPRGVKRKIYEPMPISTEHANFVVEGEIDALSVIQTAGKSWGYPCIATGGATRHKETVSELNERFADAERKPSFIVMLDNDESGDTNGKLLVHELKAAGYPAESFFLEEKMAGEYCLEKSNGTIEHETVAKVDANDLLQRGEGVLFARLADALDKTDDKLRAQATAMLAAKERERRAKENKSGIRVFPVAEYFARQFFLDIERSARYSERHTGFDNLDGTGKFKHDGQLQIFFPGLYLLGATPGAGKTTFAWQLVNQLADAGEFCIFCSYEMSALELYSKSIARELYKQYPAVAKRLNLSSANIRRGAGRSVDEVNKVVSKFAMTTANLRVLELTNTPVTELFKHLSPLVEQADKPPVVVVDYLQIIPSPNSKAPAKEKIDDLMLRLKNFQRDTNSTVIVISAFNRASDQYVRPKLSSFRESSAIEYSADVLWALDIKDEEMTQNPRPVTFICLKNRNGNIYDVYFNYYAAHDYFQACTKQDKGTGDDE